MIVTMKFEEKWKQKECLLAERDDFLGYIMRKVGLENLVLTVHTEGHRDGGKQRTSSLRCLCKFLIGIRSARKISSFTRATIDRNL